MTSTAPRVSSPAGGSATLLWVAIAITITLWASAFVAIRATAADFGPGSLTLGRIAIGSVALTVLHLALAARRRRAATSDSRTAVPRGRLLLLVVLWGIAWFGLYNLALNAAEQHVDAGTAALLVNIAPMITAVLAGLLLGEGFPRRLIGGMLVALTGVAVIALSTSTGQFDVIGVVLGVAAAVLYGGAATLQKLLLRRIDAPTMTWIGCLAATLACLPFAPELVGDLATAPASSVLAVVYLGVFPTAVAFTTWGYVLARTSAGRTAATTYAVPAVVVALSGLVLDETPPLAALIGGAIALGGVAVATLRRR
ncbi:Threonine/homoserine efflux transporter RhtA [Rathayibacter oskolensis]|uniref:Threonine/homoserine efflux transporter RhtA n=1 Tax=Rathayibacter oskolensis TaxID=1891671 RepID=A0A1X7N032_9MICO|nr:DMT family transporter [Rathayibacter oskolensis]SMH29955.1 Threonine/homoserine efflux transporter RhtA [Rathayibacter oskolensis]